MASPCVPKSKLTPTPPANAGRVAVPNWLLLATNVAPVAPVNCATDVVIPEKELIPPPAIPNELVAVNW